MTRIVPQSLCGLWLTSLPAIFPLLSLISSEKVTPLLILFFNFVNAMYVIQIEGRWKRSKSDQKYVMRTDSSCRNEREKMLGDEV